MYGAKDQGGRLDVRAKFAGLSLKTDVIRGSGHPNKLFFCFMVTEEIGVELHCRTYEVLQVKLISVTTHTIHR